MVFKSIIGATCTCLAVISFSADAALVSRLGGLAYYDTEADLTWLADANYAETSGYDADGTMSWEQANDWAAQLDIDGVAGADGWRLATSDTCRGSNCTGSEMGNLFYNVLGNLGFPDTGWGLSNTGPFSNIQSGVYWSGTETSNSNFAYIFAMNSGAQSDTSKEVNLDAWAVYSGDIGGSLVPAPVPVPAAVWLFGSGLIGLVGLARRKA